MNKPIDKRTELQNLERQMLADRALPLRDTANLVFGEGNVDCAVMFIGEAPGANEDRARRPFVGRGGQLLDRMNESIGWKRASVYITNIVKRRPPENRDPLPDEIEAYKPYLTHQIAIIAPRIIVTLGRFSMNYFLPEAKITRDHGRTFTVDGRIIYPVFHPAAALRAPEMMRGLRDDFQKLPKILSGEITSNIVLPPAMAVDAAAEKAKARAAAQKPQQGSLF